MIHYSCDRCSRPLDPQDDVRYCVQIETRAVMDSVGLHDDGSDRDHLLEIHEILERADDLENELIGEEIYQRLKFDLCSECFRKFMSSPVGSRPTKQMDFSSN
ncbi:MAG: hypothetical protein O2931_04990 [Planctomycetota bacterium]|nr:hypothetical protein [Planctomycetota bacterium]MDA1178138.1 hypothetical protein [Planctomycetota bacterium]